eukprot:TRINITY_DN11893_c0_g1_i1.p1 TRINITY_DN11893_c0_g1~~TRINITY_DN11893_c0_g1_i1.p1  ORF type:complete len:615 (-),score=72.54 TRINITY_DN11893_c0_g1_i1:82-1926(-)
MGSNTNMVLLVVSLWVLVLTGCNGVDANTREASETEWTATYLGRQVQQNIDDGRFLDDIKFPEVENRPSPRDGIVSLAVTPDELCSYNGTFSLSWQGFKESNYSDIIAIYTPAHEDDAEYLDYIHVGVVVKEGETKTMNFSLLNMRTTYQFRYFNYKFELLGKSKVISVCDLPMQVHTSLTNTTSEMRVMWVTTKQQSSPTVIYGPTRELGYIAKSYISYTYYANEMCGSPSNKTSARLFRDPGYINDVVLTGLEPNTTYYYRVSGDGSMYSELFSFLSAPIVGATVSSTWVVYGDMGEGAWIIPEARYTAQHTAALVENFTIQMVQHIGDISYARGQGWVWEYFFNLIQSTASKVPYMVDVGNHEYDHLSGGDEDPSGASGTGFHPSWGNYGDDSLGECGRPYFERFHMPENADTQSHSPWYYSFDFGAAHIIHMSTEHNYTKYSEQYDWLERDLSLVDRSVTPWVLLHGHRPMYSGEYQYVSDGIVAEHIEENLEDLIHEYGVDIAFWGHYHAYERTCTVYKQNCIDLPSAPRAANDVPGTTHIVVGTAGAPLDGSSWSNATWTGQFTDSYGYGMVNLEYDPETSVSSLTFSFHLNSNNSIFDQFTLSKIIN